MGIEMGRMDSGQGSKQSDREPAESYALFNHLRCAYSMDSIIFLRRGVNGGVMNFARLKNPWR